MLNRSHFALLALLLLAFGCDRTPEKKDSEREDGGEPQPQPQYGLAITPDVESIQKDLVNVYCVHCHSGRRPPEKLDLTDLASYADGSVHEGGYPRPLIVPSKPLESMFYLVIKSTGRDQMPPANSGLPHATPQQQKAVKEWIGSLQPMAGDAEDDGEPGADDGGATDEPGDDEPGD